MAARRALSVALLVLPSLGAELHFRLPTAPKRVREVRTQELTNRLDLPTRRLELRTSDVLGQPAFDGACMCNESAAKPFFRPWSAAPWLIGSWLLRRHSG